jgi:CsoR family transcriptional regulator, copper-sensing transcriptional repressor
MSQVRGQARRKIRVAVWDDGEHVGRIIIWSIVWADWLSDRIRRAGGSQGNLMKMSAEAKEDMGKRLRRLEGQVRGVQKMLDEDRDCREIVQQLAAIRSAAYQASLILVRSYASECLMGESRGTTQQTINELVDVLTRVP